MNRRILSEELRLMSIVIFKNENYIEIFEQRILASKKISIVLGNVYMMSNSPKSLVSWHFGLHFNCNENIHFVNLSFHMSETGDSVEIRYIRKLMKQMEIYLICFPSPPPC